MWKTLKEGTSVEDWRIQLAKHCVLTYDKDEDNSLKNQNQNNTYQASSKKFTDNS